MEKPRNWEVPVDVDWNWYSIVGAGRLSQKIETGRSITFFYGTGWSAYSDFSLTNLNFMVASEFELASEVDENWSECF